MAEFRCIGTVVDAIFSVAAEFIDDAEYDEWVTEMAEQMAYRLRDKGLLAEDIS